VNLRDPDDPQKLWANWLNAANTQAVSDALLTLYQRIDQAIAQRSPTCWTSGKCCNFDEYDHLLYVTGLESAWFVTQINIQSKTAGDVSSTTPASITLPQLGERTPACPYQINKLCTTHTIRPLGCRVFFCQQGTQQWQNELYEDFLAELRTLHEAHTLPYRYMEWRDALSAANHHRVATM